MKKLIICSLLLISAHFRLFAQGSDCASADAFCTGSTYSFPAATGGTDAQVGPDYGCLISQPNPAWYYLQVGTNGDIVININSADAAGSPNDVDFICYGPFTSLAGSCTGLTGDCTGPGTNPLSSNEGCSGAIVDCSYSISASEVCGIPGAVAGQWYMLMITNYADVPSDISFSQSNTGAGAGSTNCDILCSITALTAVPGACDPATNTYSLSGTITYTDPPTTGTLTVTNTCSGATQVFNAPFAATSVSYSLAGLPSNGAACSVTAVFSGDPTCTFTSNYTAPPSCTVSCAISAISFTAPVCNNLTQQYDISGGSVTFVNPPTTGSLTITNPCGGAPVILNAPFTSPAAFSFTGLTSNGAACDITATFTATPACTFTQAYTAPAACPCSIPLFTATPGACNPATQQYDVSGTITFVNVPTTGTFTISNSCSTTPVVFNAPFSSPVSYSFTGLPSNGAPCNMIAVFSANPGCISPLPYNAPAPCTVGCSISALTATPSACDPATNNYSVSGSVSFTNPPSTGTLTVASSCGGMAQVFNAPFTGPLAYALNGLTSDGNACTVAAVFSADATCSATQAYTAPAACSPCPVLAGNTGPYCQGAVINLTASTVTGATYSWTGPAGFVSALQNPVIPDAAPANTGYYSVTINVPGTPSCSSMSLTSVVVNSNPIITVNSPSTCAGASTTLTASGATTYSWSNGATGATITVPGTTTSYTVTGTSMYGCTGTAVATVTTTTPPTVSFTSDTTAGCSPVTINFTADETGNPGAYYNWSYGDGSTGTGATSTHTYTASGCQTVILMASYSASCYAIDSVVCMINVFQQPDAGFQVSPSEIDILSPEAEFTNLSTHSTSWLWNFGDGSSDVDFSPSHTYPTTGTYPVMLYAYSAGNCIDSAINYVVVNDISTIYVPNAFTPNGDGNNDIFNIGSHGIAADDFEMLIFDRWGNRVLKTTNLYEGWNGAMNNHGSLVQQDVYVYKISYTDLKGRKRKLLGHVTLVE